MFSFSVHPRQDEDLYHRKGSKVMTGKAMAHKFQRTAALSDDEGDDDDGIRGSTKHVMMFCAAGGFARPDAPTAASCPVPSSAKFSYASKQQKEMRLKAKEWFSSEGPQ
jgi:hypothetical protein